MLSCLNSSEVKNENKGAIWGGQMMQACLEKTDRKKCYETYRGVCRVAGIHWLICECSTSKMSAKWIFDLHKEDSQKD